MKKTCSKCKTKKDIEEFHKGKKYKDGHQVWCKVCALKARIDYFRKNKQRSYDNVRRLQRRNKEFIAAYLLKHPCVDCGFDNVVALDFDHVKGKKINCVTNMVWNGNSIENIIKEIKKCEVRCANCHRIVTAKRRKRG